MFLNAVRSVRHAAPLDDLLVVDNGSHLADLRDALETIAGKDPRITLVVRESNDLSRNTKVGGLYDAYRDIVAYAIEQGYDLLHLIQGDMQLLWWDSSLVNRALQLYGQHPTCVNICTVALPAHVRLSSELEPIEPAALRLSRYGLTDTGLYHLGRWQHNGVQFGDSEAGHGRHYLGLGMTVLYHPWPSVAQIPWPAVVRDGRVRGSEVKTRREFLLKQLDDAEVAGIKASERTIWLEDLCIPWGWICLTPLWTTALESADYWMYSYRDARARGVRAAWPRWERRGVADEPGGGRIERRPAGRWQLVAIPIYNKVRSRFARYAGTPAADVGTRSRVRGATVGEDTQPP